MTENQNQAPALTLEPAMTRDKVMMEEAARQLEAAPAAAAEAAAEMDTSMLSEAERGILDLNTLVETNQSLIDTISEVMKIQDEGRAQRVEAEKQLVTMENELKQKLLELKH